MASAKRARPYGIAPDTSDDEEEDEDRVKRDPKVDERLITLQQTYPFLVRTFAPPSTPNAATIRATMDQLHAMRPEIESRIEPTSVVLDATKAAMFRWPELKNEADKRFTKREPRPQSERWPYFFALPRYESEYHDGSLLKMMPYQQQVFMQSFAPNNKALLELWMHTFQVLFSLKDREREHAVLADWVVNGYEAMRRVLRTHPLASKLTDLVSLIPLVERGLETNEKDWRLYERFFLPGPDRVGVALPTGIVLFEGEGTNKDATDILRKRVRVAPFSTSWHINEAMAFADQRRPYWDNFTADMLTDRSLCLFAHKIMSDGIIGVDAQQTRWTNISTGQQNRVSSWFECEILIQPLVSVHLVDDVAVAIDRRAVHPMGHDLGWTVPVAQRVLFTHLFLGPTCPCEAYADADSNKQQRIEGKLRLAQH